MTNSPPPDCLRFVLLRHVLGHATKGPSLQHGSEHLDWMFQVGQSLRTWSTTADVDLSLTLDLESIELPNHRIVYLEKQGDIGGDRGTVHRVASGQLNDLQVADDSFCAELIWEQTARDVSTRHVTLHRIARESWRLRLD